SATARGGANCVWVVDRVCPHRSLRRDQSFVAARESSFHSPPCFCQFIRIERLAELLAPSATAWASCIQWKRTMATSPTTRVVRSLYSSDSILVLPLVAFLMKVALSSMAPLEWL